MNEIFLSYAWADNQKPPLKASGLVDDIYEFINWYLADYNRLQAKPIPTGIFLDKREIRNGALIPDQIASELGHARVFLAATSSGFFQSEWCPAELDFFWGRPEMSTGALRLIVVKIGEHEAIPVALQASLQPCTLRTELIVPDEHGMVSRCGPEQFRERLERVSRDIYVFLKSQPNSTEGDRRPALFFPLPAEASPAYQLRYSSLRTKLEEHFRVCLSERHLPTDSRWSAHLLLESDTRGVIEESILACLQKGFTPHILDLGGLLPADLKKHANWVSESAFLEDLVATVDLEDSEATPVARSLAIHHQPADAPVAERVRSWLEGRIDTVAPPAPASRSLVLLSQVEHLKWARAVVDKFRPSAVYLRDEARRHPQIRAELRDRKTPFVDEKHPERCPQGLLDFLEVNPT